jgi:hypothetical protein
MVPMSKRDEEKRTPQQNNQNLLLQALGSVMAFCRFLEITSDLY